LKFTFKTSNLFLKFAYFDVEISHVEQPAGDKNFMDVSQLKVRKIPGTKIRAVYGPMIFRGPIDNSYICSIKIYAKQGNEYRLRPYSVPTKPACDLISQDPYIMPEVAKVSNMTLPVPCPVVNVSF
jgi:hypothetical protein